MILVVPANCVSKAHDVRITIRSPDDTIGTAVTSIDGEPYLLWSPVWHGVGDLQLDEGAHVQLQYSMCLCKHCCEHVPKVFRASMTDAAVTQWQEVPDCSYIQKTQVRN